MKATKEEILNSPLAARIFVQAAEGSRLTTWTSKKMVEADLLVPIDNSFSFSVDSEIKSAAERPVSKDEVGGTTNAFNALWLFLLTEGTLDSIDNYGTLPPEPHDIYEGVHLGICGLDEERSTMPQDTSWTHFVNTYAEDDETHGIEGRATCRCNEVVDRVFSYEFSENSPGLADMLIKVTSY